MHIAKYLLMLLAGLGLMLQHASAETISISGSTTVQKYVKLAAKAYSTIHPEMQFNIYGGGSTNGVAQMIDKRTQIGMLSRELTVLEKQQLGGIHQIAVALDAVVPVVSQEIYKAGIQQIKPEILAQIYRGKIINWQELGGPNHRIIVVDKNTHHGTRAIFANYVLASDHGLKSPASIVLDSDNDVVRLIKSSDQAIGYVGIAYLNQDVRPLRIELGGNTVEASHANIRSGVYPLSRNLYLLVHKSAPDYVQRFVKFMLSPVGQSIVERAGYLPLQ